MFNFSIPYYIESSDSLILLLLAIIIEIALNKLKFFIYIFELPVKFIEYLTSWFDRKLNKQTRSHKDRAVRGFISVLIIISISYTLTEYISYLSQEISLFWIFEFLLLIILIGDKNLCAKINEIASALQKQQAELVIRKLSVLTSENYKTEDHYTLARIAIQKLAISFPSLIIAPLFWYLIFELPGLALYKTISIIHEKIGQKNETYQGFGFSIIQLNKIFLFIPAVLGRGLILIVGILISRTFEKKLLQSFMLKDLGSDGYHYKISILAFANALGLALHGPPINKNLSGKKNWLGEGRAKVAVSDIENAVRLYKYSSLFVQICLLYLVVLKLLI